MHTIYATNKVPIMLPHILEAIVIDRMLSVRLASDGHLVAVCFYVLFMHVLSTSDE